MGGRLACGPQRLANNLHRDIGLCEHKLAREPYHPEPKLAERALPARVCGESKLVIRPINLYDEASLWSKEVDDEVVDDDLPAEDDAELASFDELPEGGFRRSGMKAHGPSAGVKQEGARGRRLSSGHEAT